MKIRSYVVKNYMLRIVCTTVMYGILGYLSFMAKEYIGVFCILMCTIFILNWRIDLYEDKIIVYEGFKIKRIKFDFIKSLDVGNYEPKIPKINNMPTMFVKMEDDKIRRIYYYNTYSRETMIEIVDYSLKRNGKIKLGSKIKAYI